MVNGDGANQTDLWLEDVHGERALAWVADQNERTRAVYEDDDFRALAARLAEVLDSDEKIPYVTKRGKALYNFWTDASHERGVWRRTTRASWESDDPEWETVLDIDALNAAEGEDWVWHGAAVLRPDHRRALVALSHGGLDADVTREFDLKKKRWVKKGFYRPESKGGLSWIDEDTVFVYADFGPGTLTSSGYPRIVKRWKRGTSLAKAKTVYEGEESDLYISAVHDDTPGFERDFVQRGIAFYETETYLLQGRKLTLIDVPRTAEIGVHKQWLTILLREEWLGHPAGSLIVTRFDLFLAGRRDFDTIFKPGPDTALQDVFWTRRLLVLTTLKNAAGRLTWFAPPEEKGDRWRRGVRYRGHSPQGTLSARPVDDRGSDKIWVTETDFLSPTSLQTQAPYKPPRVRKSSPAFFDTSGLVVEEYSVLSDDGTRVPYRVVSSRSGREGDRPGTGQAGNGPGHGREGNGPGHGRAAASDAQGPAETRDLPPALLYGYGGFEVPMTASYSGILGRGWLERGGTYALACIRGGGEFGPTWHQAALKENRHRAYQDFAAVARDLVDRGLATKERLGAMGRSNGGLLAGNMLTQYPHLFGAIVIQAPLLDMRRYSQLLAGASWMAEYGDPDDPEQWKYIRTFSPYHLFDPSRDYPPTLIMTSTADDRVHPGHARRLAALMESAGKDVHYYENVEGGHGGAASNAQLSHMHALAYEFLWRTLSA